jgi:Tfp pilus assembly protein PilN
MRQDIVTTLVFEEERIRWASVRDGESPRTVNSGTIECGRWIDGDEDAISSVVAAIKSYKGEFEGRTVVALPAERLLLRVIRLPAAEDDEFRSMVELQVDKLSPFAEDDTVWSYETLASEDDARLVLMAMASGKFIAQVGAVLDSAGLRPHRVEAAPAGVIQVLRDAEWLQGTGREVALLIRDRWAQVLVFDGGVPVALRSVDLPEDDDPGRVGTEIGGEIAYTLLSLEVEHGVAESQSVTVWVDPETDDSVVEAIGREAGVPVSRAELVEFPEAAEGAATRQIRGGGNLIDLTPGDWQQAARERRFKKKLLSVAGGALGLWITLVGLGLGVLYEERSDLEQLREKDARLSGASLEVRELRARALMLKHYTDESHSALECLWEITRKLPDGVDLGSFSYRKGETIRITGEARLVDQIYNFKTALDESDLFVESVLQSVRRDRRKRREIFDIEIQLPEEEW